MNQSFYFSKHAIVRTQQRGIKKMYVDLLLEIADCWDYAKGGAEHVYLSKNEFRRLKELKLISTKHLTKVQRLCLVIIDGTVITIMHQTAKFRRYNRV